MREQTFDFYMGALTDQIIQSAIRAWIECHPGIEILGYYSQLDRPRELFTFIIYYTLSH